MLHPLEDQVPDYRVREIPEDLFRRFKALSALQGRTVNQRFLELMVEAVDREFKEEAKGPPKRK